jgi:hypothetical protein
LLITVDVGRVGLVLAAIVALSIASIACLAAGASYFAKRQRLALPLSLIIPFVLWGVPPLVLGSWPRLKNLIDAAQPLQLMTTVFRRGASLDIPMDAALLFAAVTLATSIGPFLLVTWGIERRMRA